jgi:starch synthase
VQRSFTLAAHPRVPLFSMAARLVTQKGIDLILESPALFSLGAQFVFIGAGESRFEEALTSLAVRQPDRIAINTNFTDRLEHLLISGADFLLMPCQYEPCGLTQMRSQRYGAPPIVRNVGGLRDTVEDGVNGFTFEAYTAEAFTEASFRALDNFADPSRWQKVVRRGMAHDFNWQRSVATYLDVYRRALAYSAAR